MQKIRPFLAAAAALAAASGIVLLPVVTSATPASATATCAGTSLAKSLLGYLIRIPTVGNATPNQWSCILGPGDDSTAVSRLQIDLNNCFGDDLTVDGDYGPLTEAAVEGAQRKEGVTVDGIYGPQTIKGGSGGYFEYQVSGYATGFCDGLAAAA
jgi:Putative peptidoglycan binding domain